jgi:hypothetical protein
MCSCHTIFLGFVAQPFSRISNLDRTLLPSPDRKATATTTTLRLLDPPPLLTPLLCAGAFACYLGASVGGSFIRSAASARQIGDGGGYLVYFAAVPCVVVSLAVFACSAALGLGPDVALRNSAAASAALALPMAAVGARARF